MLQLGSLYMLQLSFNIWLLYFYIAISMECAHIFSAFELHARDFYFTVLGLPSTLSVVQMNSDKCTFFLIF